MDWRKNNRCCVLYSEKDFKGDWDKFCILHDEWSKLYDGAALTI